MAGRDEALMDRLRALTGPSGAPPGEARDPVNPPMIRHWCDAIGDRNPIYTDPERAAQSVHGGIVAPPTMLQAWTMPGLRPPDAEADARRAKSMAVLRALDEAGFTSVVATNCTQEYRRYLRPGDLVRVESYVESVSERKRTALGVGHFVTQAMVYTDQHGEQVATMKFRLLKFRPPQRGGAEGAAE